MAVAAVLVFWFLIGEKPIRRTPSSIDVSSTLSIYERETVRDVPDPAHDGWNTETLSNKAASQLNALSELLANRKSMETGSLRPLLADSVSCSRLCPEPRIMVFQQDAIRVERFTPSASRSNDGHSAYQGVSGMIEALQQLSEPFQDASAVRAKFKVFHIESESPRQFTTRQFFSLSGQTPAGMREQNATWRIGWAVPLGGSLPRIERIASC